MSLPSNLSAKYINRFNKLIQEGENVINSLTEVQVMDPEPGYSPIEGYEPDTESYVKWKTNCITLLNQILTKNSVHYYLVKEFISLKSVDEDLVSKEFLIAKVAKLKAIKDDFEEGFLEDLSLQIEAEISADYMTQAEALLNEEKTGRYNHVPAAVLAGAVLEKSLRTLCGKQVPPIQTLNDNGKPLTLHPLTEELKKAKVFNEVLAKQLQAWAVIRNKAAHGEFDKFNSPDVELMIKGVNNFLATYMT